MVVILRCESETLTLDSGVLHALQHVLHDDVQTGGQTSCHDVENLRESLVGRKERGGSGKKRTKQKAY